MAAKWRLEHYEDPSNATWRLFHPDAPADVEPHWVEVATFDSEEQARAELYEAQRQTATSLMRIVEV